jgi:hypothetical protein
MRTLDIFGSFARGLLWSVAWVLFAQNRMQNSPDQKQAGQDAAPPEGTRPVEKGKSKDEKKPGPMPKPYPIDFDKPAGVAGLTNDSILKMVKAGLSEDIVVSIIKGQPASYTIGPDELLALKEAGVSDKILAAMIDGTASGGSRVNSSAPPAGPAGPGPVYEAGVYFKKADNWTGLPPEVVNFNMGCMTCMVATAGIAKGALNGHINGAHSPTQLEKPVTLLVYVPEGVAITEFRLVRLQESKDAREFRTVAGGEMHASGGGATRDLLPFEAKQVAPRTYEIVLPQLGAGDYGLLPPAESGPTSTGRIAKIYSFRIVK